MSEKITLLPPFDINYRMMSLSETKNYGHDLHNAPEAWKTTKGEGVTVAVIDTGLPVHRDLEGQVVASANFTNDPIEDIKQGHSTHVAGIIAAKENNEGVVGIAPKAKLVIAKSLGDDGGGSDESIADAIDWCIEQKVDIINMSLGAPAKYAHLFTKTEKAVKKAYENNIVVICASGNENASKVGIPARYEEAIAIAAVNSKKQRANFSNKGPTLDFAASGVDIISTFLDNTYASLSGTSMASPQVAGLAALIISEHKNNPEKNTPLTSPEDVRDHIRKMCIDLGPAGWDKEYGYGLPVFGKLNPDPEKPPPTPPQKTFWEKFLDWLDRF
jgi:subtilisin family serine protease